MVFLPLCNLSKLSIRKRVPWPQWRASSPRSIRGAGCRDYRRTERKLDVKHRRIVSPLPDPPKGGIPQLARYSTSAFRTGSMKTASFRFRLTAGVFVAVPLEQPPQLSRKVV